MQDQDQVEEVSSGIESLVPKDFIPIHIFKVDYYVSKKSGNQMVAINRVGDEPGVHVSLSQVAAQEVLNPKSMIGKVMYVQFFKIGELLQSGVVEKANTIVKNFIAPYNAEAAQKVEEKMLYDQQVARLNEAKIQSAKNKERYARLAAEDTGGGGKGKPVGKTTKPELKMAGTDDMQPETP